MIVKQGLISGVGETSRLQGTEVWLLYILLKHDQYIFFMKIKKKKKEQLQWCFGRIFSVLTLSGISDETWIRPSLI